MLTPNQPPSLLTNKQPHHEAIWAMMQRLASQRLTTEPLLHEDLFTLLYAINPERVTAPPPGRERDYEAFDRLWSSGLFEELRHRTKLDPLFSWLAADEMGQRLAQLARQIEQDKSLKIDMGGIAASVEEGIRGLEATLDDTREALEQLGIPTGRGGSETEIPSETQLEAALRITQALQNSRFLELFQWLGRLKAVYRRSRDESWTNRPTRLTGVARGNAIARQTPYQAMLYANPATRPLWQRQYGERGLQQYDLKDRETPGKGPFIVLHDKSGSMKGEKDAWATATIIQLQQQAEAQGRDFVVIPFHYYALGQGMVGWIAPGRIMQCGSGQHGEGPIKDGAWAPYFFPKGKKNAALYMEIYSQPANGGDTVTFRALEAAWRLLDSYPELKEADIVCVTDGQGGLIANAEQVKAECQKRKARLWMLLTLYADRREALAVTHEENIIEIKDLASDTENQKVAARLQTL